MSIRRIQDARRAVAERIPLFSLSLLVLTPSLAIAQESLPSVEIGPAVVASASRVEEPLERVASAVTIISAAEIEKRAATGLVEALRGTPGLDIYQSGGAGAQSYVFLRGAAAGQTLVLIDGVRVGEPGATDGAVDFGLFAATDIDRVEVLRGPQSALYGSDAMGGVIEIFTRKGEGRPKASVLVEGGSYGTAHTRATLSGSEGPLSYAFAIDALHIEGFPRYGYRIRRPLTIGDGVTPLPPLPENDPTSKGAASARLSYRFSEELSIEGGFMGFDNAIRFDNPSAYTPSDVFDHGNHQHATFAQGFARVDADLLERRLHNRLTVYGNVTNRDIWQKNACYDSSFSSFDCQRGSNGSRTGVEYQGDLRLGSFGLLTFGAREETERMQTSQQPAPAGSFTRIDAAQTTHSGFAQHKITLLDRFDVSFGGRVDAVDDNHTFGTWRATAAYRLEETGTRLRGAAGTGARVASLYQRFSAYGDPRLAPETNIGVDIGVDQTLLGGRLVGSASLFESRYRNLVEFGVAANCSATQVFGCYYNVGRARTAGVEFSGEAILVPDQWRLRASYTHLAAENLETHRSLYRRPSDKGTAAIVYTGLPGLELEARLIVVGPRQDFDYNAFRRVALDPYARLDLFANYRVNERISVFARIENVNDARYEEVYNYGTAGRSAYGGVKFTW